MQKTRLDNYLVENGIVESRSLAQRLVMAGQVRVDGQVVLKPATFIASTARIELEKGAPFVSRGGQKLEAALDGFHIPVSGRVCADVGASTGGFTDCLLKHRACRVYAIDVGKGILAWQLRQDSRVVVMENTNARFLKSLPEPVSLVTIDVSFISVRILLPVVYGWFQVPHVEGGMPGLTDASRRQECDLVVLVKPQFEAGRAEAARGAGVIRDGEIHRRVLVEVLTFAAREGFGVRGLLKSPLVGPKGNVEFLAWLALPGNGEEIPALVDKVLSS
ncbi:MAG: TlyA family RNA methyltransferase [Anaerolineales bacterium]|nr:TlyA family RNA methyltransferase [Anaerolineales bacterium]